uniref:Uncharacterized protein n=1 Tax=Oryza punctata TaxID=4537 RepID=A0A0E0KSA5_ORYPU
MDKEGFSWVSKLPNEKEAVYGALDEWTAFEPEFPTIAAAKVLEMLKRWRQWLRIIQVAKWLMSKGQENKEKIILEKNLKKYKYIHFNGKVQGPLGL